MLWRVLTLFQIRMAVHYRLALWMSAFMARSTLGFPKKIAQNITRFIPEGKRVAGNGVSRRVLEYLQKSVFRHCGVQASHTRGSHFRKGDGGVFPQCGTAHEMIAPGVSGHCAVVRLNPKMDEFTGGAGILIRHVGWKREKPFRIDDGGRGVGVVRASRGNAEEQEQCGEQRFHALGFCGCVWSPQI